MGMGTLRTLWAWLTAPRNREGLTFAEWQRATGVDRDDADTRRLWAAGAYPGGLMER